MNKLNINLRSSGLGDRLPNVTENSGLSLVESIANQRDGVSDRRDYTLLHLAAVSGNLQEVKKLIKKGADINAKSNLGLTPLELASNNDKLQVVKFLVDYKDEYGYTLLHYAARDNNSNLVDLLLEKGANIHAKNNDGCTPLHLAAINDKLQVVERLIEKGADIYAKDNYGYTPLHLAASYGHLNVAEELIEKGADIYAKDNYGYTPLHLAAINDKLQVVEKLIEKRADIHAKNNLGLTPLELASNNDKLQVVKFFVDYKDKHNYTLLHHAAKNNNSNLVDLLLEKGANIYAKDNDGYTPLHLAAGYGRSSVVEKLIEKGADIYAKDNYGYTPLHLAASYGYLDVVEKLIEKGADIYAKNNNGATPLHLAASYGRLSIVEELIERGANIYAKNNNGATPLHLAASYGYLDVVEKLIEKRANIYAKNNNGATPLHLAAVNGNLQIVEKLVEERANIYAKDNFGLTPLDLASNNDELKIVKFLVGYKDEHGYTLLHYATEDTNLPLLYLLLKEGANINAKNNSGATPLHLAVINGQLNVIEKLMEEGADINAKNNDGATSLHLATDYGNLSMVKKLVEKGANANAKNRYGNTPMYFNASYGYAEIVERFVEKEANTNAKNKDGITPLDIARDRKHNNIVKYLEEKLNRERESVQHKHRHHHGEYDRRHPSHEPLFVDSGNQPEVTVRENVSKNLLQNDEVDYNKGRATSGASKPSFWIDAVKSVSQFISFSFKPTIGVKHSQPSKAITTVQGIDMNGTLFLLDVFTNKIIGQKYIFTVDQSMFPLEAQEYALNIIEKFEKVLNETATKSGISVTNLNFDPVAVQSAIVGQIISEKFSEISKTLYSFAKEACPEFKQADKFLDHLRSNLESKKEAVLLQQKVEKPSKILDQQVSRKVELSKKPDTFLNGTSVVKGIRNVLEL